MPISLTPGLLGSSNVAVAVLLMLIPAAVPKAKTGATIWNSPPKISPAEIRGRTSLAINFDRLEENVVKVMPQAISTKWTSLFNEAERENRSRAGMTSRSTLGS